MVAETDIAVQGEMMESCTDIESQDGESSDGHVKTQPCKKLFKCRECSYVCRDDWGVRRHFKRSHKDKLVTYQSSDDTVQGKMMVSYPHIERSNVENSEGQTDNQHMKKRLKCSECSYVCKYNRGLRKHFERKHQGKLLKSQSFDIAEQGELMVSSPDFESQDRESSEGHMKTQPRKKRFECSECSYVCTENRGLRKHFEKNHKDKVFKSHSSDVNVQGKLMASCSDIESSTADISEGHMEIQPGGKKRYKCSKCSYVCINKSNMKRHFKRIHNKVFKCGFCDYVCKQVDDLRSHKATHRPIFRCIICNYTSPIRQGLSKHTNRHLGIRDYLCDLCGHTAISYHDIKMHISTHVRLNILTCDICGYSTHNQCRLSIHMRVHSDKKPFQCEICGYATKWRTTFMRHLQSHTANTRGERFICEICKKSCAVVSRFQHMKIHGEKKYKCSVCDYGCYNKINLAKHMAIHTGEKKYKCTVCGTSFSQKGSLTRHLRIHTGERKFKCDICGYAFNQDSALNRHMRTHSDEKLIKCSHCDYSCHQNSQLKMHYIRRHKELNEK